MVLNTFATSPTGIGNNMNNSCPLCAIGGPVVRTVDGESLRAALESYFGEVPPPDALAHDYAVARCPTCTIEYAVPRIPGNSAFYNWITERGGYYPDARWEWDVVLSELREAEGGSLLEVGCGAGHFLMRATRERRVSAMGIDLAPESIAECRAQGLDALCCSLEEFLASDVERSKRFKFVVAFHCLEHLADPLAFAGSAAAMLAQNGRLFFSTPYSPMSFEELWFDPLNHPPHHLTRWNEKSYRHLARMLGLTVKFFMPRPSSSLSRALRALMLSAKGPHASVGDGAFIVGRRPHLAIREWYRQSRREKVAGRTAADVVLVEMRRE